MGKFHAWMVGQTDRGRAIECRVVEVVIVVEQEALVVSVHIE